MRWGGWEMRKLHQCLPRKTRPPPPTLPPQTRDGTSLVIDGATLESSLQYSNTPGLPRLLEHLSHLQVAEHGDVQPNGTNISITTGSQDALAKVRGRLS